MSRVEGDAASCPFLAMCDAAACALSLLTLRVHDQVYSVKRITESDGWRFFFFFDWLNKLFLSLETKVTEFSIINKFKIGMCIQKRVCFCQSKQKKNYDQTAIELHIIFYTGYPKRTDMQTTDSLLIFQRTPGCAHCKSKNMYFQNIVLLFLKHIQRKSKIKNKISLIVASRMQIAKSMNRWTK